MTIESASFPDDLSEWDGKEAAPYYFEVFGETTPLLDLSYAEVVPAGAATDAAAQSAESAPVYEYWWTIGHNRWNRKTHQQRQLRLPRKRSTVRQTGGSPLATALRRCAACPSQGCV
jgi:hypothetical protein